MVSLRGCTICLVRDAPEFGGWSKHRVLSVCTRWSPHLQADHLVYMIPPFISTWGFGGQAQLPQKGVFFGFSRGQFLNFPGDMTDLSVMHYFTVIFCNR